MHIIIIVNETKTKTNFHSIIFRILQKYEVEFLLQQQWFDPRLRYANQSQYEYLNAIHHHEDIWLPDTYFIMHGDFKDPIIPMHFALRIYRNGTITYLMRFVVKPLFSKLFIFCCCCFLQLTFTENKFYRYTSMCVQVESVRHISIDWLSFVEFIWCDKLL